MEPPTAPPANFEAVYTQHAAMVLRGLRRLGVPERELEDAAQEVFVIVHRKLPSFAGRSSLKTWVFGICMRVASDWRQRAHHRRETDLDAAPKRSSSGETATREVALRQARRELDRILDRLDQDKREVFVAFELEQVPMADVATSVGVPVQTAYARLYAARRFIESEISRLQEVST